MKWTAERKAKLTQLWSQTPTLSATRIARKMGGFAHCRDGGKCAVLGQAHRMDLPPRVPQRAPKTREHVRGSR